MTAAPSDLGARARAAFERLAGELAAADHAGYDPYDALASPALRRLARRPRQRQAAIQLFKRSPVNLRSLAGVPRQQHVKGLALLTSAYAGYEPVIKDGSWRARATHVAGLLAASALEQEDGVAWGYDFDVQTRWGYYPRGTPNAVATTFACHALLDAREAGSDADHAATLDAALAYIDRVLFTETPDGAYFRYYRGSTTAIHNASVLLAGVCARACEEGSPLWEKARTAIEFSLSKQTPDGAWEYGEAPGLEWIDGYHTGFILDGLDRCLRREERESWREALRRGTDYYQRRLFDPDGAARATVGSRYPLDIHAAATAITTLSRIDSDACDAQLVDRVLAFTLDGMLRADGHFAFQRHRTYRNSVPYIRWSDGHMMLALSTYVASRAR